MRVLSPVFPLLAAACACLALPALAQQTAPAPRVAPAAPVVPPAGQATPLSRAERAKLAAQDAEIIAAARQVLALVDGGRVDEVWEGASSAMKRAVPRGEFARELALDRRRLGNPMSRLEPVVTRERYAAGGRVPQGEYLNVAFPTRFARSPQPIRELVSFRLDEDRVWRVSGYSVR